LEISSGKGQHISYFAEHFPNIEFQPTKINRRFIENINACTYNLSNVLPAKYLDLSADPSLWLGVQLMNKQYDYILNINMLHVSHYVCTEGIVFKSQIILIIGFFFNLNLMFNNLFIYF